MKQQVQLDLVRLSFKHYELEIGANLNNMDCIAINVVSNFAVPVSYLGEELGTVFSNKELQKLVQMHAKCIS